MSDTMLLIVTKLKEQGFDMEQVGRWGVWVLRTSAGLIDLGPTPSTGYEWARFTRRLEAAGVDLPQKEERWQT